MNRGAWQAPVHRVTKSRIWLKWPHGLEHARHPSPLLSPGVCSNSRPLSQWCYPTISSSVTPFSPCPQSFPASVFSSELALRIRWPKHRSFNFSISSSSKYLRLISFRIDCFDLLAAQRTLKSLLQHHSSKVSILHRSAFFVVQLSHPYMTTENHSFDYIGLISKVMFLCFFICCLGLS